MESTARKRQGRLEGKAFRIAQPFVGILELHGFLAPRPVATRMADQPIPARQR
jgi:hypothetical protein